MKVILLEDDVRLGDKGATVEVKKGFAVNFLIPGKKAIIANEGNIARVENELKSQKKKIEKERGEYNKQAEVIKAVTLEFAAKAAVTGHLFGTITPQDVADQLKEKTGIEISKKKIILNTHIKTEGRYSAIIKLFSGINVTIPVIVRVEREVLPEETEHKPSRSERMRRTHQHEE